MSNKKNRSGTSQNERALPVLRGDYISVEERSLVDLLMYLREYAEKVRFYSEDNRHNGFWSEFLEFSDDEMLELAEFAEDPTVFSDDYGRLAKYSQPHLALLLTFLKLLKYPQEKFAELTEKNVEYFYKKILKLNEQAEVPDQVHVILSLARDVREHLLKKGTLFNAGKDQTGVDLYYELQEDTTLNQAEVAEVKTIHFRKTVTDLKYVHERYNRGDAGFEKILCLVLGNLSSLPPYTTSTGQQIEIDAVYLRTELYKRIKGKEKDDLEKSDADYIFQSLCFRSLKDFMYCLDLLYREINRGYVGVTYPEDQEWEKAYRILEEVHKERIARTRRAQLKAIHQEDGFESMMRYAFGEPEPGDMLYKFPGNIKTLEELANSGNEATRQYIQQKLCMTVEDFRTIIAQKDQALTSIVGEEFYTLLEAAWTKKRGFVYPEIGSEIIQGFHADHIYSADQREPLGEFAAFGGAATTDSSAAINLGFAVSSPLLRLHEGEREIEMVVSCQDGTIDYDKIAALLANDDKLFTVDLSVADGWREADHVDFAAGKFMIKPELKTYSREDASLVCDTLKYPFITKNAVGTYLGFANGKVYRIEEYEEARSRIYLKSINLQQATGANRWFKRLRPKTFVAELKAHLTVSRYAPKATSTVETFDQTYQGKYFVDQNGKIFLITEFIDACEVNVAYCGELSPDYDGFFSSVDRLFLNKVWATIELEEMDDISPDALSGLVISGVYAEEKAFSFSVTDGVLKITYPEGATVQDLIAAWELWKDQPQNSPGRYEITGNNAASAQIGAVTKELVKTGEIIKRYESPEENGIRVTYRGRPHDQAFLEIKKPSTVTDQAIFSVSGNTLTIAPGRVSRTTNQIVADWRLWLQDKHNDAQGFHLESKDQHQWKVAPVYELDLKPLDRQVKKCDICDLYGVGIRVLYTGPVADEPRLILKENSIDLFDFAISPDQVLTIKYPSVSQTSAHDLVAAWEEWRASELNDPGNFSLQTLGDGLWTIRARTEKELQAIEDQTIECTIPEAGIIARYKLSATYQNAIIELVKDDAAPYFTFAFEYSDEVDTEHDNVRAKKLTIKYPALEEHSDPEIQKAYQVQQVRSLLTKWNREFNKHGFSLAPIEDNAMWAVDFPEQKKINFREELNYVCTVDPNGFIVKFKPDVPDAANEQKTKVVIEENTSDHFAFEVIEDYPNNLKILVIKYPTAKKNRTVAELLKAWKNEDNSLLEAGSLYWTEDGELHEFQLVPTGTGKWQITGVTNLPLTAEVTEDVGLTDPVNQRFYQYQTEDVHGFSINYTGPGQITPQVTITTGESETFEFELFFSFDQYHDFYIGEALCIKCPKDAEYLRIIDLLTEWENFKQRFVGQTNRIIGFELVDTSPVIQARAKDSLLTTGDVIREYRAWGVNGACFTYIGHRTDPTVILEPIHDFNKEAIGQKLLWDNGEIFTITDRVDKNFVTVEPETANIPIYGQIKLYPQEAVCLEALKFTIRLNQDFPPVLPLADDQLARDPVIRVLFQGRSNADPQDRIADFYDCFRSVCLERIDLQVTVTGLKDIKMRGDIALINPDNPFPPFGQTPEVSARFHFANAEICTKKLDAMAVNVEWMEHEHLSADGLPDMESYYSSYSRCGLGKVGTIKNEDFEVKLQFLDKRTWISIDEAGQGLFNKAWSYRDFSKQTYQGDSFLEQPELPKDPLEWPRYYRLELANQGFLRKAYEEVLANVTQAARRSEAAGNIYDIIKQEIKDYEEQVKAAKVAEAEAREKGDAYYQPAIPEPRALPSWPENDRDIGSLTVNEPYTPVIKSMRIDYVASARLNLTQARNSVSPDEMPVQLFRFNPFGYKKLEMTDNFLLPQYEHEGYLFIGVRDLAPPQNLSLLFQMISGSGDVHLNTPEITWSYLSNNQWIAFTEAEILKDKTSGLQDTGIIQFQIPEAATNANTVLPPNLYWIRAAAKENITAVPHILDVKAGAVCVTYLNRNNDPEHLTSPLPASRITELTVRDAAISEVFQPYSSFNGKREETTEEFYIRVSERLKHKNRALTLDDYEKLILNRFPQIYKVKCLPQDELVTIESAWHRGEVVVVVILKNSNSFPFFPLKPKAPNNLLNEIKQYIQTLMPSQVKVTVRNPRFEEVQYRLAVKFVDGADRGFYINKLNEDLKRYLSPWAYEKEAEISFGSTIYSSSIINYLENLDYVDYIANFCPLRQTIQHKEYIESIPLFLTEDNAVTTKYPDSVLVSADQHVIDVITTEFFDPGAFRGIGHMKIGFDFWIDRPGAIFSVGIGEMEIEAWPVLRYAFAGLPVKVKVKAIVRGQEYVVDQFQTQLSRADSQQIWDALKANGYLLEKGLVNAEYDLYTGELRLDGKSVEDYLKDKLSQLTFEIKASHFDPSAGRQDEFSYTVQDIYCTGVETAVLNILKTGLSFDGISQYPFIVY